MNRTLFDCGIKRKVEARNGELFDITATGADLGGGGGGRWGRGPPFQFVGDLFFVKIYNNFIIL